MPAATGTPAKMEFEMPRRKAGEPDTSSFGPDMKWSPEAPARRSEAAKKAAATRKAKKLNESRTVGFSPILAAPYKYPYFQNSRVARWALSGVSIIAMNAYSRKLKNRTFLARQVAEEKTAEIQHVYRRISQHSVKILNK